MARERLQATKAYVGDTWDFVSADSDQGLFFYGFFVRRAVGTFGEASVQIVQQSDAAAVDQGMTCGSCLWIKFALAMAATLVAALLMLVLRPHAHMLKKAQQQANTIAAASDQRRLSRLLAGLRDSLLAMASNSVATLVMFTWN